MATENINFESPRGWRLAGRYLLLAAVTAIVLFPVYTTVLAALKPATGSEPSSPTWRRSGGAQLPGRSGNSTT